MGGWFTFRSHPFTLALPLFSELRHRASEVWLCWEALPSRGTLRTLSPWVHAAKPPWDASSCLWKSFSLRIRGLGFWKTSLWWASWSTTGESGAVCQSGDSPSGPSPPSFCPPAAPPQPSSSARLVCEDPGFSHFYSLPSSQTLQLSSPPSPPIHPTRPSWIPPAPSCPCSLQGPLVLPSSECREL